MRKIEFFCVTVFVGWNSFSAEEKLARGQSTFWYLYVRQSRLPFDIDYLYGELGNKAWNKIRSEIHKHQKICLSDRCVVTITSMVLDEFTVTQLLEKLILQRNLIKASDDEGSIIRNTVIPTLPTALTPGYITLSFLIQELLEHLQLAHGRLTLTDASNLLSVDRSHIESAAKELCRTENDENRMELLGENNETLTLVTSAYIQNCMLDLELLAQMNGGKISVSDAASHLQLPLSKLLQLLTATDNSTTTLILSAQTNNMVILTREYKRRQQRKVQGAFLAITVPTYIDQKFISSAFDHVPALEDTLQLVKDMCDSSVLPGELRIPSSSSVEVQASPSSTSYDASSTSAAIPKSAAGTSSGHPVYIPKIYVAFQRQTVDHLFRTNGYIRKSELDSLAISKGKMLEFVMQTFPNAVALPCSIIDPDVIITLAESVISEADQLRSFVDLRLSSCLPECIISNHEDVETILKFHLMVNKDSSIVRFENDVFYFSSGMVEDITRNIIPPLAQQFSKDRAAQLFQEGSLVHPRSSATKIKKKSKGSIDNTENSYLNEAGVFPLSYLVANIVASYPALASLSSATDGDFYPELKIRTEGLADSTKSKVDFVPIYRWEEDEERNNFGVISEFCRNCLMENAIVQCADGVRQQIKKLKYCNKATGVVNLKMLGDLYSNLYSLDETFEQCFKPLCHYTQIFGKLSKSLDKTNKLRTILERLFLISVGADFSYRLTEYCILKYIVDYEQSDVKFSFTATEAKENFSSLQTTGNIPHCCLPLNPAIRDFPKVVISCKRNSELVDPLEALREELPSPVGTNLARLWTYCGGECYHGGEVTIEDKIYVRSGNIDNFFSHLEESCLQTCGIPFKTLDKKSEKLALVSRYRALSELLDDGGTMSDREILQLIVILLLQQTTNLAASGINDLDLLTQLLLSHAENVLPSAVVKALMDAMTRIEDNVSLGEVLIQRLRKMAFCQNIKRYKDDTEC